ncbi:O-fucosyltransferase 6-like isoform X2 [Zingiber officinale]|uniref:O-fucosyltransferase 6-like isoform X2 n=1 Tax=Zingiber officinale TaxID=94328 RepID=UPI001C4D98A7|nr:O-fucosyltransferase 6-like isoform X2 [Zingiber officinale]
MGLQRRRRQERRVVPAVPVQAALSAAVLLLLVVLSFHSFLSSAPLADRTSPDPVPIRHLLPRRKPSSILLKDKMEMLGTDAGDVDVFLIPSGGESPVGNLWGSKLSKDFYGCSHASSGFATAEANTVPNRYLMIATSGGLNQQRTGITDAVVAARILNATLVVPVLDQKSFWKDASDFSNIFNVEWFIASLDKDVKIIKELPEIGGKVTRPQIMRVPRKCNARCYENRVLPVLMKKHVVRLTKFDYRLSNKLETDLQKLRCRVNYHGLKFTDQIQMMGDSLIQRMKAKSNHFIALHLRFETDMLAFSGCYYGGGEKERTELGAIRKRWKTLHTSNPEKERRHGKCPLTPEEIGLMLRALGFGKDVHIYVASGEIYGGEERLAPLKALFPNFHSKETLATKDELAPFSSYSSRMAALDFIVCDGSDVFVTNNNGNMARILAGRRRYFGHKRTIRPNAKKLYSLFLNRTGMTWETFSSKVHTFQKGFMGEPDELRPGRGEFHEYPSVCICERSKRITYSNSDIQNEAGNYSGKGTVNRSISEDLDWIDFDYGENAPLGRVSPIEIESEYDAMIKQEDLELEEILSD